MDDELSDLLYALDGVAQDRAYHPEGDALFHSLQAFEHARRATADRALWAAALFHDVGKAGGGRDHDRLGAELLEGLVGPRVVWLVRHHFDLLRAPGATRRRLRRYPAALADLDFCADLDAFADDAPARGEAGEREAAAGEALRDALAGALTAKQREVVEMHFFEGLSQGEIARRLGVSQQVVQKRLHGDRRGGRLVGGALPRLREALRARPAGP